MAQTRLHQVFESSSLNKIHHVPKVVGSVPCLQLWASMFLHMLAQPFQLQFVSRFRIALITGLVLSSVWLNARPIDADDADARYFAGLRERRLFSTAEEVLLRRLEQKREGVESESRTTIELAQTFVAHAQWVLNPERDELLERARRLLDDQIRKQPTPAMQSLLNAEQALIVATKAELTDADARAASRDDSSSSQAREQLHTAAGALREARERLQPLFKSRQPIPEQTGDRNAAPSLAELRHIDSLLTIRQAQMYLAASSLVDPKRSERIDDLLEAESLTRQLSTQNISQGLQWEGRLILAKAVLLRGETTRAMAMLTALKPAPSPIHEQQRTSGLMELALLQKNYDQALELFRQLKASNNKPSGPVWQLQIEALVGARDLAASQGQTMLADELEAEIQLSLTRIREQLGTVWWDRADRWLHQADIIKELGPELAQATQQARSAYLDGRKAEALAQYQQAFKTSISQKRLNAAAELGFIAGSIAVELQDYSLAATLLEQVAGMEKSNKYTSQAAILWAWSLGQIARTEPTPAHQAAAQAALLQNARKFAGQPAGDEALKSLGLLAIEQHNWTAAKNWLRQIAPTSPLSTTARLTLLDVFEKDQFDLAPKDPAQTAQVWNDVQQLVKDRPAHQPLPAGEIELLVRAAWLAVRQSPPAISNAEEFLQLADDELARLNHEPTTQKLQALQTQARILLIASGPDVLAAEKLITPANLPSSTIAAAVLEGLLQLVATPDLTRQRQLQVLIQKAAEQLESSSKDWTPEESGRAGLLLTRAWKVCSDSKRSSQWALFTIPQVADRPAERRELLQAIGTTIDPAQLAQVVKGLQAAEARLEKGSAPFLALRIDTVQLLVAANDRTVARKLLTATQLIYRQQIKQAPAEIQESLQKLVRELATDK